MGYIEDLRKTVGSRPLLMIGANVIVLNHKHEILLQLRTDNHCFGIPGGALEIGESLEETAKRELAEETSLVAKQLELFNIYSGKDFYYKYPNGDEVFNVITTYICKEYEGSIQADLSECSHLTFYPLNNLPNNLNPPEKKILKEFIQANELVDFHKTNI